MIYQTTLQRQVSRIYHNKVYFKYVIVLPPKIIKNAGFIKGQKIEIDAEQDEGYGIIYLTAKLISS